MTTVTYGLQNVENCDMKSRKFLRRIRGSVESPAVQLSDDNKLMCKSCQSMPDGVTLEHVQGRMWSCTKTNCRSYNELSERIVYLASIPVNPT